MDHAALAALAAELLTGLADTGACGSRAASGHDGTCRARNNRDAGHCPCTDPGPPGHTGSTGHLDPRAPLHPAALARLHPTLLWHAASVLSGPGGLAAFLRTRLTGDQVPSASLPLDTGTPTSLITGALRRAVIIRDRHCAFPGCDTPPAACQAHHITPKASGQTTLTNLVLLCAFHHLIAAHHWGWALTLNAYGTVTTLSPDRSRTLHSHGPPQRAA